MSRDHQAELMRRFERLFEAFQVPILNYLHRLLGDAAQAEEVTQDVFVKAYGALARLPDDANHRAWLYRIATNAAYDVLRRRKLVEWLPLLERDSLAAPTADPDGSAGERDAVQAALSRIPPQYRAPLVLFSVQGYSVSEISSILDLSEGAVRTRLFRAREKFREAYGREA